MVKQYEWFVPIYDFIETFQVTFNYSPSLDDLAVELGIGKEAVLEYLDTMEMLGMIEFPDRKVREIKVLSKRIHADRLVNAS